MARSSRTTIRREGWYYLVVLALVLVGALGKEVNLMLILGGMLAGPLLLSWRAVRASLRGLHLERNLPKGICAGDLLVTTLRLKNTRRRLGSWDVLVEDQIHRESNGQTNGRANGEKPIHPGVLIPYLPAGQSRDGAYRGRLSRRGRYRLGPVKLSTQFPFGLLQRTISLGQVDNLTVFPRLGTLTQRWARRHRDSFEGARRREQRHGPDGDFYGVRPWRSGDSRRWIHWRSSARLGELVVCQFEQPRNRDVAVLLDLWQPAQPSPEHQQNVELAVSFAATIVTDLCRQGSYDIYFGTTSAESQHLSGPASPALLHEVMDHLALAEASDEERLVELLRDVLGQIEPGAEIVLVGARPIDLDDPSALGTLWTDSTRRALKQHIRLIDTSSEKLNDYFQMQ